MPAPLWFAAAVWLTAIFVLALRVEFAHRRFSAYWHALGPRNASGTEGAATDGALPHALEMALAIRRVQEDPYLERARRHVVRRWCELLAVGLLLPTLALLPAPLREWLLAGQSLGPRP